METLNAASTAQKKGAAELLILAQLEAAPTHGYEICQRIAERSSGVVTFNVASLYPILYDMERRKLITGRWVEKAGQRRRRYYRLTAQGMALLTEQRRSWSQFFLAMQQAAGLEPA
jgi:PadR family transcriptional regulator, regulatory protein PadR